LRQLEKEGDVKKGEPVKIDGIEYHEYFITDKARKELKAISKSTNGYHSSNVKTVKPDNEKEHFANDLRT